MKIKINTPKEEKKITTNSKTVNELLKELKINPVSHITILNGEIVTEDEEIQEKDEIDIKEVVSGG